MIARTVPTKLFIFKEKENTILIREERLVVLWFSCVCVFCLFSFKKLEGTAAGL